MADKKEEKNNPNLGCLEEDDEFEEFPVEGIYSFDFSSYILLPRTNRTKHNGK